MKAFSIQLIAALVVSMISVPAFAQATNDGQAWRALAEALEGGVAIEMRLRDGRHFKATFVAAHPDAMVVQRKTRLPVPVEDIAYDSIVSLACSRDRCRRERLPASRWVRQALRWARCFSSCWRRSTDPAPESGDR